MSTSTHSTRRRIAAASLTALGAMLLAAPEAQAKTFKQSCIEDPHLYHSEGVRGVYSIESYGPGSYLQEVCRVFEAGGGVVITASQNLKVPNKGGAQPPPTAPLA